VTGKMDRKKAAEKETE